MLRVHKAPPEASLPLISLPSDAWFCRWFELEWLPGAALHFPCYQWLEGAGELVLREGAGEGAEAAGRRRTVLYRRLGLASGDQEGAEEEGGDWQKQEVVAVSLQWKKCTRSEGTGGLTTVGGRTSEARDQERILSIHALTRSQGVLARPSPYTAGSAPEGA